MSAAPAPGPEPHTSSPPSPPAHAVLRALGWAVLALYFAAGLGFLVVRHVLWPRLDQWREPIEQAVSARIGLPVRIGSLETSFDRLRPLAVVRDLRIGDPDAGGVRIGEAEALLAWRSLLAGEPRFDRLRLSGPAIELERLGERRWRLLGVEFDLDSPGEQGLADWMLAQRRIEIVDARVRYRDARSGRSLALERVGLQLRTVGRHHRLGLVADGGVDDAGVRLGAVTIDADIYREPLSRPADPASWSGEARLALDAFDARALGVFVAAPPLAQGVLAARGTLRLAAGRTPSATLEASAREPVLRFGDAAPVVLRRADASLSLQWLRDGSLALAASHLSIVDEDGLALGLSGDDNVVDLDPTGRPRSARASLGALDAERVAAFARRLPLPTALAAPLATMRFAGRIDRVALDWPERRDEAGPAALERLSVELAFSDLGFEVLDKRAAGRPGVPGFRRLSGSARVTAAGGEARIDARDARLDFPGVFADRNIPFDMLAATVAWRLAEPDAARPLALELRHVAFANADVAGELKGRFEERGRGLGVVDLEGRLTRADAARAWRYLPLVVEAPVRQWVQRAIVAGRSEDVGFRLRGDLADFPFRDPARGEFRIAAAIADGVLRYAPDWPAIEQFRGTVLFERGGMHVRLDAGRTYRVALADVDARIADLRAPLMKVSGKGAGPAQDMIRFVNESPIRTRIDDFTVDTRVEGDASLALALDLPLETPERTKVRGSVALAGNRVVLDTTLPPFSDVSGRLSFTEEGLALEGVEAGFLQGRVKVQGRTPAPARFEIVARGNVPAAGLRGLADNVLTRALSGTGQYVARIDVDRRASHLRIESDLRGLASSLPPPFEKSAGEAMALVIASRPTPVTGPRARPAGDRIDVSLGRAARLAFERERDPRTQRLHILRGAFALGAEPVLPARGLAVRLDAPEFDADRWNALLHESGAVEAASAAGGFAEGFSLLPEQVSIVAKRLRFAGKDLHDVVLGATRREDHWQASVRAREVDGFFDWRDSVPGQPRGVLTARFARLEIPRGRAGEVESMLHESPQELPALDVVADDFVLGGRALGRLALGAHYEGGVWQIDRLQLRSDAARLDATGRWSGAGGRSRTTQLEFDLALDDAGKLLARLGFPDTVRGGTGSLNGKLDWRGSPLAIDFPSLSGNLALTVGRGQFLKSDPGLAKLIGVLSLQSLPRRLSLDFQDVFLKGFAFDQIRGDAHVEAGVVRTEDLMMTGVQAEVRISGEVDVARETQALRVQVRPELNAGIASLAYAAIANPALGLGSFFAQMLLRKPLQEIFGHEFAVTGAWADPVVEQRSAPPPVTSTVPP